MPRYFFHTSDGSCDRDDVGVELADPAAARREAIRYGGSLLHDNPDIIAATNGLRVEVVDEQGQFCTAVLIHAVDAERGTRDAD
ncbi:hypothetical protein CDQ92_07745 [Sphingopyxis bauzanensis]|uniref:DUF6894 domain-containing protein n=1 Tax=Sphingopyxis bauzanensis TaxID=651663 RepID=A0A246JV79_9SPHN|nr:hypothetical protein [Sphingopyxis bauzanensis]OWQ96980.1 hypothetical protein CDQ92_07745 [Sphingopyxis bauzanensis]GGJ42198.1 hypothetical protein GCM10011393_10450 [Sphingopyxis bauzanensis]